MTLAGKDLENQIPQLLIESRPPPLLQMAGVPPRIHHLASTSILTLTPTGNTSHLLADVQVILYMVQGVRLQMDHKANRNL